MNKKSICIIGSGWMAAEHVKASLELGYDKIFVIGRTLNSFKKHFGEALAGLKIVRVTGGLASWFRHECFEETMLHINSVAVHALQVTTIKLLKNGVKRILLEKPGALNVDGLKLIRKEAKIRGSNVLIGYNRRHYASTEELKERLSCENISSFEFEFTEWIDTIDTTEYPEEVLVTWLKSNSAHVIDLAFYLVGGLPKKIQTICGGVGGVIWHPAGSVFAGCGKVDDKIFTYQADWMSQGRWKIYIRTEKGKYVLEPLEKLSFIPKNSLELVEIEVKTERCKPGLEEQIRKFERNEFQDFADLTDQIEIFYLIQKMTRVDG